ncbi:hypothetical protein [Halorussus litoreus]|uniref:hypothetical protein n=1 Tax=Halorussus litoreus TaxID=1710536 RepID=UPI000E25FEF0|nr:hypothetical protein [Halorussus litoreus]
MRRSSFAAGLIVGLLPTGVLYLDGYWDPQLAVFVWASFTVTGWLGARHRENVRQSTWWTALLVALVIGGAQFGVHMDLPIGHDLTVALWFLVLGVGTAAALVGVEIGVRASETSTTTANTMAD